MLRFGLLGSVCLLGLLAVPNALAFINYGECESAFDDAGLCIHIADCQYLYKMLLSNSSATNVEQLKKSQCGYDNTQKENARKILVCCPLKYCKESGLASTSGQISAGNVLPEAGVCGSYLNNRIVGGKVAGIDEFAWMVLLRYKKPGNAVGFHCGGSLINSRYVLTAGHCINIPSNQEGQEPWKLDIVRLGEWNLSTPIDCVDDVRCSNCDCAPPHVDVQVELAIVHPGYEPQSLNQFHDIALIRLAEIIPYTEFIQPICLPIDADFRKHDFKNTKLDVAGWGATETSTASPIKLKITVDTFDLSECQKKYSIYQKEINGAQQICAGGEDGVDTCGGDSGGPLMAIERLGKRDIYFLAGIVSYGPKPCGFNGWPGVYTRVGNYIDWIQETIQP